MSEIYAGTIGEGGRWHFIGAGGIGMSGLAKVLLHNGCRVTGSDMEDSVFTRRLNELGADIRTGHSGENLPGDLDGVVISAAIRESNPELAGARARELPVLKYAQMLGRIMSLYQGIAVAGTHGKSTTSGWLAHLMEQAGLEPSYIIGADVLQLDASSAVGSGPHFVAEACEYDRSFLNLRPAVAVVLNIEPDHLDYYKDIDDIISAFAAFAVGSGPDSTLIVNGNDRNTPALLRIVGSARPVVTFGMDTACDYYAANLDQLDGRYTFDLYHRGTRLGNVHIGLPGFHNVYNALAVTAAARTAGVPDEQIIAHLGEFTGIDRRLMLKARTGGVTVLDDYAHHPTEIRASLLAIRERYRPKRLWCVFQPHQYSRTRFLLEDFAQSFKLADSTIVPHIYFVRDTAESRKQVNSQMLVEQIRGQDCDAMWINDFADIVEYLVENVAPGDLVVTMGAGDIWKVADEYIQRLGINR